MQFVIGCISFTIFVVGIICFSTIQMVREQEEEIEMFGINEFNKRQLNTKEELKRIRIEQYES